MKKSKPKPKNSGHINRWQETRNKRALGSLAYLAYQIHNEQKLEDGAGDITPAPKTDHKTNTGETI